MRGTDTEARPSGRAGGVALPDGRASDRPPYPSPLIPRRAFLASAAVGATGLAAYRAAGDPHAGKALFAVTLDLEMSRNFPTWDDTHWDYEKGNLNDEAKRYTAAACERVKAAGGVVHCFAVGRTFEQPDTAWLKRIAQAGHPVGNHTYDHVNVLATKPEDIQFRFRRAPWLIDGKTPEQVITDNIRLTTAALKTRVGVDPAGFRTPGGFPDGLAGRADVRKWLRDLGFTWVSSKYPAHPPAAPGKEPSAEFLAELVRAQGHAQPFAYPDGLAEVPMSPISDIGAFRTGRWKLDWFLAAVRRCLEAVIADRACFDFLGHPSCLYVVDPQFKAIDLILELVDNRRDRAAIVGLDEFAKRAK